MMKTYPATAMFRWCVGIIILSLIPGLFTTLMEPDAALYAGIAKQIVWRNDWVNLFADGKDWLDKPHFPFWAGALSFKIFGVNTFAYKLPAFLCWLLGARFTYLFARHFYGEGTAQIAALVYLTALHAIISSNDVRAEPYLTCFLIAASWYLAKAMGNVWNIVPAAFFTGLAMMTKGPFVLIPIGSGMLLHWAMRKDWKQLVQWRWYAYLVLSAVFVLPEIWCLYLQFDARPDKTIFDRQGVSGIRFFLWDSQFGRFFNTGPIKGKGDLFFFLHTLLWAFLPWSLLLYAAIFQRFRRLRAGVEWITLGAGIFTLLVFSLSRFQLPHYLNILFPYFSVLLAAWLFELAGTKKIFITQRVISLIVVILLAVITVLFRPPFWWVYMVISAIAVVVWSRLKKREDVVRVSVLAGVCAGIFLNVFFYPALVTYQGGSTTAGWKNKKFPGEKVNFYRINSYSFEFYSDAPVQRVDSASGLVYTGREGLASLEENNVPYKTEAVFPNYRVTRLDGKFVNRATRARELDSVWVLRIRD
ncbi:ArnT family glycosyltransferase [Chitinophaga sp. GCM10012297]|uniref:Glycosyltransferase family 39 protein n=1 Tax=Chitinophaga chungangae TaxID=2821488 RepID=A0ABS3YC72_9BACT|nr:glycosyltransferase family 39 protein [Chitinophaga chungangae]MBO9152286.1 glycosyltransferase family 39 protein [Chitinophaga chungangae]